MELLPLATQIWPTTAHILSKKQNWTHHVSRVQPAEYISMSRGPKGLRYDWCWGQGSQGHPSGEGSESAFCCTAGRWAPVWRRSPACCNCRGEVARGEGSALGPWGAQSCRPPGPWRTLAGWRLHEPGEDQVNLLICYNLLNTQSLNSAWNKSHNTESQQYQCLPVILCSGPF